MSPLCPVLPPPVARPKKCRGPWVILVTDRRKLGRPIRVVMRVREGTIYTTEKPSYFLRFNGERQARKWLKKVKGGRFLFTVDRLPPLPPKPKPVRTNECPAPTPTS